MSGWSPQSSSTASFPLWLKLSSSEAAEVPKAEHIHHAGIEPSQSTSTHLQRAGHGGERVGFREARPPTSAQIYLQLTRLWSCFPAVSRWRGLLTSITSTHLFSSPSIRNATGVSAVFRWVLSEICEDRGSEQQFGNLLFKCDQVKSFDQGSHEFNFSFI